jgi:purine nucleoside phosphorylase
MSKSVLGIIGGSGIYDLPGIEGLTERRVSTPWGDPSDALLFGRVGGTEVVFLSRHGRGHRHSPSDINYRANIDAMKRSGVTDLVSFSACGSYREELSPGTFVLVDNFVDRTTRRVSSFFGAGCVAHVPFAHPVGPALQDLVAQAAMVTDFDCWHPTHDSVEVAALLRVMDENRGRAQRLFARLAKDFPAEHPPCPVRSDRALDGAVLTQPSARDPELVAKLQAVAGRVLGNA